MKQETIDAVQAAGPKAVAWYNILGAALGSVFGILSAYAPGIMALVGIAGFFVSLHFARKRDRRETAEYLRRMEVSYDDVQERK